MQIIVVATEVLCCDKADPKGPSNVRVCCGGRMPIVIGPWATFEAARAVAEAVARGPSVDCASEIADRIEAVRAGVERQVALDAAAAEAKP